MSPLAVAQSIPHYSGLSRNKPHSPFRDVPQLIIVPMRAHDSAEGMRIRSQQQVSNFVRHHVGQEHMPKPLSFSKFLNAVIENIGKVADPLIIGISGTKHIDAITN